MADMMVELMESAERLVDTATRLMGFARSVQSDAELPPELATAVLRALDDQVDTAMVLARLETIG